MPEAVYGGRIGDTVAGPHVVAISVEDRRLLASLARKPRRRVVSVPPTPSVWKPTTVVNPSTSWPFTSNSAWEHIAELLESGHPVEEIRLSIPMGQPAFVLKQKLGGRNQTLYIKIHFNFNRTGIIGRSFHL